MPGAAVQQIVDRRPETPAVPLAAGTRPHVGRLFLSFAAIYLIWGSTFLAIRFAVATIPPLLMMGGRSAGAGAILYLSSRLSGAPKPRPRQWVDSFLIGSLLFLVCHGVLAWAEQRVASGPASLMSATIPLWMVVLDWVAGTGPRPRAGVVAGLMVGFTGVGLLVLPGGGAGGIDPATGGIMLLGSVSWVAGSLYSRRARLPGSLPMATGMQLLAGGILLFAASLAFGEWHRVTLAAISVRSAFSLAYLIVFGSVVAFTAYNWLLRETTPARLSTYSYVNPLVAVLIGWAFGGEPLGWRTLVPTAVIITGVGLTLTAKTRHVPISDFRSQIAD